MTIEIQCVCGKQLRVKEGLAGKRVKCPACGKGLTRDARRAVSCDGREILIWDLGQKE